jgi:hypothetical protein
MGVRGKDGGVSTFRCRGGLSNYFVQPYKNTVAPKYFTISALSLLPFRSFATPKVARVRLVESRLSGIALIWQDRFPIGR